MSSLRPVAHIRRPAAAPRAMQAALTPPLEPWTSTVSPGRAPAWTKSIRYAVSHAVGRHAASSKLSSSGFATRLATGTAIDTAPFVPRAVVVPQQGAPARPLGPKGPPGLIYEIAVKAFSMRHPGIAPALRGRLAALAEPRVIEICFQCGCSDYVNKPVDGAVLLAKVRGVLGN